MSQGSIFMYNWIGNYSNNRQ
uniref:Uncharacterized protein n=1 Tax=Anguilla anguilla TaxID=7936 RepID=A0A0E9VHZ5_ANGAN